MSVIVRVRKIRNLFPGRVRGGRDVKTQTLAYAVQTGIIVSVVGANIEVPFNGNVDLGTFE